MKFTTSIQTGFGRGKLMGYPTLNLSIPPALETPFGIYAGWVYIATNQYQGAFHYGPIPTFNHTKPTLEVFVLETTISDVPPTVSFELISKIRDIRQFPNAQALASQITLDVERVKKILSSPQPLITSKR